MNLSGPLYSTQMNGEIHDYSGFVEKAKQFQIPVAAIADIMSWFYLKVLLVGELMWWWVLLNVWSSHGIWRPSCSLFCLVKSTNDLSGRIIGVSLDLMVIH